MTKESDCGEQGASAAPSLTGAGRRDDLDLGQSEGAADAADRKPDAAPPLTQRILCESDSTRPLTHCEVDELARYNGEVARGIVHTEEWKARMARLQFIFDTVGWDTSHPKLGRHRG